MVKVYLSYFLAKSLLDQRELKNTNCLKVLTNKPQALAPGFFAKHITEIPTEGLGLYFRERRGIIYFPISICFKPLTPKSTITSNSYFPGHLSLSLSLFYCMFIFEKQNLKCIILINFKSTIQ